MQIWKEPTYHLVETEEQLDELAKVLATSVENNNPIAVDIESTGPTPKSALDVYHGWLLGISFAVDTEKGYYIPLSHTVDGKRRKNQLPLQIVCDKLNPIVKNGGTYLAHNAKFDYKFLWRNGLYLYPVFWDTMLAVQLMNGDQQRPSALKTIIRQYVEIPHTKMVQTFEEASHNDAAKQDPAKFAVYAIDDVIYTYYVYRGVKPQIDKIYPNLFYNAEAPLATILGHMEMRGIEIDVEYYQKIRIPLLKARDKIQLYFGDKHNISIGSPAQVGKLLREHATVKTPLQYNQKSQSVKTDVEALQIIQRLTHRCDKVHKIAKHILAFRGINKALSTYVDKYPAVAHQHFDPATGKLHHVLHTNFKQMVNSGRLSSSPNVQNITRDGLVSIRRGFVARAGYNFIEADWSGCELRMVAIASQDPTMHGAFTTNPRKADLHQTTADEINTTRHIGKTLNFSIIYGATEYSIAKTLNCSKEKATEYLNLFFKAYPGILTWKQAVEAQIIKNGYTETFYGRRRMLTHGRRPDMRQRWMWEGAVRELTNHIIQGTSADLLKFSMVKLARRFAEERLDAHLLSTTHDSVVVEAAIGLEDKVKAIMLEIMEVEIQGILLPVDIDVKKSFAKAA